MDIKRNVEQILHSTNFRNGMLYTLFSFVNSGIGFILLLILARYLEPSDYGQLSLFTTFITLVNIFFSLCTVSYVGVSFFQKPLDALRQVIMVALSTSTAVLLLLSLSLLLFPSLSEKLAGIPLYSLWLGLLICYFQVFNSLNLDIWRLEEKPISYGIYAISQAVCNFVLTFILIVGMEKGWEGRVYAWFILAALYFAISIAFLIRRRYLVFSLPPVSLFKETYIYALPLLPHTASFWLKQGLDRYIINYFHDQATVGYFSFAMNLASIIIMIGTAFNATNSVYIYKKLAGGYVAAKNILSKQTKIMTALFFVISIGVVLFALGLIYWFIPRYGGSMRFIVPLCFGAFFQCIYLLWVNYLFFYKKTRQLMHITLSTAILQVILSVWLTRFSPLFTAYISMGITALTMLLVFIRSRKELRQAEIENR